MVSYQTSDQIVATSLAYLSGGISGANIYKLSKRILTVLIYFYNAIFNYLKYPVNFAIDRNMSDNAHSGNIVLVLMILSLSII